MTHGDGGKGDAQRPTDHDKFSSNYDNTFKKQRDKVKCDRCGEWFFLYANEAHKHTCNSKETK